MLESNLSHSDLTGANLTGATLSSSTLFQTNMTTANLASAKLVSSILYRTKLASANLAYADISTSTLDYADFSGASLANASLDRATLLRTNFESADLRGAAIAQSALADAIVRNAILTDGRVSALHLVEGDELVIRDDDGIVEFSSATPWLQPRPPIPVQIRVSATIGDGGALRLLFEADPWDSLISFEPGIPVELGGTLELAFADDVDASTQVGRTIDVFDWTGVNPEGEFQVASPYLWDLSSLYSTGEIRLTGTGGVADYDQSGLVDQGDLDLVLLNWGEQLQDLPSLGWINDLPVGSIDQAEFDKAHLNWGRAYSGLPAASIPEPATAALLLVALLVSIPAHRLPSHAMVSL